MENASGILPMDLWLNALNSPVVKNNDEKLISLIKKKKVLNLKNGIRVLKTEHANRKREDNGESRIKNESNAWI